ncbi:BTAD domain-containing putative transcriptional regulator [Lentzea sp. NPDC004782]|uniref:AfsR/SARP family transcriptional regulator n=1 Tax=Lentzea sp. NPDC004782 TaxID=3154458 RepID=UPI0033B99CC5
MRFRVLGPLEVRTDDEVVVTPQGPRKQKILAALLLNAPHAVSVDHLLEAVWGVDPPVTAARQIRNTTTELRRELVAHGAPAGVITAVGPGFQVNLDACWFDLGEFEERLAVAGRAGSREALAELERALALWRGPALDGLNSDALRPAARALDERRLAALERRYGVEIDLNGGADVLEEVGALAQQHPYRETLVAHLMRAHYRAGRQAEALAAYQRLRGLLDAELGVAPGQAVRDLYERILRQDSSLLDGPTVPRQLPPDATLYGRSELIAELRTDRVVVLTGPGGVGKSALAVHVAHRLADSFPGGQLYADLSRASAHDVLGRFLRALGMPPDELPRDVEERSAEYRSLLASRRVLIVLDDAQDERQVRPLLPGYPGSAVLITSRRSLTALREATHHTVPALAPDDAVTLLLEAARTPDRDAAVEVAALCGHLPLALNVIAARLTARPDLTLVKIRDRLLGQRVVLDELAIGDLDVRGSIAVSYRSLRPDAAVALRRLALLDANAVPAWVLAAFADQPWEAGDRLLDELHACHLVEAAGIDEAGQSRFRLHDLVHEFAAERLRAEDPPAAQRQSVARLVHGLLAIAATADRLIGHGGTTGALVPREAPGVALAAARQRPFDWFEAERALLVAAVRRAASAQLRDEASELASCVRGFFTVRQHHADGEAVARAALDCLDRDDPRALQHIRQLYTMYSQQDRNAELPALADAALAVAGALGDPKALAEARWQSAATNLRLGRLHAAVESYRDCLTTFATMPGTEVHIALTRWGLGSALADLGQTDEAIRLLEPFTRAEPSRLTAIGLAAYAEALVDSGSPAPALAAVEKALEMVRAIGDEPGEAHLHVVRAYALHADGREARDVLQNAVEVLRRHHDPQGTASALRRLGDVTGDRGHWEEALAIYRRIGLPLEAARTLHRLGDPAAMTEFGTASLRYRT